MSRSHPDEELINEELDIVSIPTYFVSSASIPAFAPRVPTVREFQAGYRKTPEKELAESALGQDGIRYSIKGNQIFVPTPLRNDIMFWFHVTRYGKHAGSNRTFRRMRNYVWWPKMGRDVGQFVDKCFICKRFGVAPKLRTFRGVLSSPQPLDLISVDFCGPVKWGNSSFTYIVCIDHCSRFVVAAATSEAPTSSFACSVLMQQWVSVFGAPSAILCDRGAVFRSKEFTSFVTSTLSARLVFTSPFYPQGNAINESCHQSLNRCIKVSAVDSFLSFEVVLMDSCLVHNSLPTSSHGRSPYYILFGLEPTFPGWQRLKLSTSREDREITRAEARHRLMIQRELMDREVELVTVPEFKVDQWVVYFLSAYERARARRKSLDAVSLKYSPSWSLPCRVVEIKDKVIVVNEMGQSKFTRQVPVAQVRLLRGQIPIQLAEANLRMLRSTAPVESRRTTTEFGSEASDVEVEDIIDQVDAMIID